VDGGDELIVDRFSAEIVARALKDTPVVMVTGPRQCGKATLVRDLDRAIIDEVQLAPRLLRAIKESVDLDCRPGRFLLTGCFF
jgi:predicted AAA+ superfamily ATPase